MAAPPANEAPPTPAEPLESVHTGNLPDILAHLNVSLLLTTYQAGRVILVRSGSSSDGITTLNTHFREFDKPMGACLEGPRLVIGGANAIWEFRNVPAAARHLEPADRHDACYLPGSVHFTGNIDIHEMGWSADDDLWLVNTRFSCLCTLDERHSFRPRWRPPFISALAAEDRCHLNGLAMRDGRARYVTALGQSDTRGGWRARKGSGGVLLDVDDGTVLAEGLSMPHSPRWHEDRLWLLESGKGSIANLDWKTGRLHALTNLPGFTRGLDFAGPLAFVGLSRVRESAMFSGLPITRNRAERHCGVWVVDLRNGDVIAFLRFEAGVDEIFAVQVLPDQRFPELLAPDSPLMDDTYVLPDAALKDVRIASERDFEASADGRMARAMTHYRRRELDQAIEAIDQCLALEPEFPDARHRLGVMLAEAGRRREALNHLVFAAEREPERPDVQVSLGSVYQRLGDTGRAYLAFQEALRRCPGDPDAHTAMGVLRLQRGEYRDGFADLTRGRRPAEGEALLPPLWQGTRHADHSLGIQVDHTDPRQLIPLLRFIPSAAERVASITVACPPHLAALLSAVPGVNGVRSLNAMPMQGLDRWIPIVSLPHVLDVADPLLPPTSASLDAENSSRPRQVPSPTSGAACRIGVVWGSAYDVPPRREDLSGEILEILESADPGQATWIDLTDRESCGDVPSRLAPRLSDAQEASGDLMDLKELIEGLDLVVGVDSAAVHLAGILGIPGRVVVGERYEWYWPAEGAQSDWYPSVRIHRRADNGL